MRSLFSFLALVAVSSSLQSFADPIEDTTQLLKSPDAREEVMRQDPEAKKAGDRVKGLGLSPGGEARVYGLSAGIFENLAKEDGGDADKLTRTVEELVRNPASLEKKLTPEQKKELESLSKEIEGSGKTPLLAP
jgi:hypothetical protein